MKKQLNHSRYIDNGARDVGNDAYERARATPTAKQIKFYKKLYAMCKENNIDPTTKHEHTRTGYSTAIDTLKERLNENGIDVNGNGKEAKHILIIGEDYRGRDYVKERIVVEEGN